MIPIVKLNYGPPRREGQIDNIPTNVQSIPIKCEIQKGFWGGPLGEGCQIGKLPTNVQRILIKYQIQLVSERVPEGRGPNRQKKTYKCT